MACSIRAQGHWVLPPLGNRTSPTQRQLHTIHNVSESYLGLGKLHSALLGAPARGLTHQFQVLLGFWFISGAPVQQGSSGKSLRPISPSPNPETSLVLPRGARSLNPALRGPSLPGRPGSGGANEGQAPPTAQIRSSECAGSQAQKSSGVSGIVPCHQINCIQRLGFLSQIQFETQRWYLGFHFLPYHIYIDGDLNTFIDQGIFVEINTCAVNMFLVNNVLTVLQNKTNYTWRCFAGKKRFKW